VTQCTAAAEKSHHHDNDADHDKYVSGDRLVAEVRRIVQELAVGNVRVLLAQDTVRVYQNPDCHHDDRAAQ